MSLGAYDPLAEARKRLRRIDFFKRLKARTAARIGTRKGAVMKPRSQTIAKEFERRLREARREVWRTMVGTEAELSTLEVPNAASSEGAGAGIAAEVLARVGTSERRLLDEIDAAHSRLAAGTFGICERCAKFIALARLRALPAARLCIACERIAEGATSA
jgi:RNA polymerase-binding protein DksA